jgi:hypothetical protein
MPVRQFQPPPDYTRREVDAINAPHAETEHIHLPSVHARAEGGLGFDYEEDLYIWDGDGGPRVERLVRLVIIEGGEPTLVRETRDELCAEELAAVEEWLPVLMDEGNPAAAATMRESAQNEFERQLRIASGEEMACSKCGCSETRPCSGGCGWAAEKICSNCVDAAAIAAPRIEVYSELAAQNYIEERRAMRAGGIA